MYFYKTKKLHSQMNKDKTSAVFGAELPCFLWGCELKQKNSGLFTLNHQLWSKWDCFLWLWMTSFGSCSTFFFFLSFGRDFESINEQTVWHPNTEKHGWRVDYLGRNETTVESWRIRLNDRKQRLSSSCTDIYVFWLSSLHSNIPTFSFYSCLSSV